MASTSSNGDTGKQTRLQEATQKRRVEDELRKDADFKRQKKMFAPRKVIGPRDILVNSKVPKIKVEDDALCRQAVKQENVDLNKDVVESDDSFVSSTLVEDPEVEDFTMVKVEETFDLEEPEQMASVPNLNKNSAESLQNHVKVLEVLNNQKEQEVNELTEIVNGLQHQLNVKDSTSYEEDLKYKQLLLIDTNMNKINLKHGSSSETAQIVIQLTSALMEKYAKIRHLSMKMLTLQDTIFGTACHSLELSKNYKPSTDFVQESFKLILPFLYADLHLNDLLICRAVCRSWRDSTDLFLNTCPSSMPFDKETHLEEKRLVESRRTPVWNESPQKKLIKAYHFSELGVLQKFTEENKGTSIVGSTVCLDNFTVTNKFLTHTNIARFFNNFTDSINFLTIRQGIDSPDFKIQLLMDRVKLCLKKLQNLEHFKLLFCIDKEKLDKEQSWDSLKAILNQTFPKNWQPSSFPKLERLVSLELDVETEEGSTKHAHFLENFSKSLITPYSEQLQRLSIFTSGIDPSDCLPFPNLIQLSIPKRELRKGEFKYQNVEKLIITTNDGMVQPGDILTLQSLFPTLLSLGFKHEKIGEEFYDFVCIPCGAPSNYDKSYPTLSNVLTLELENCGSITFTILECFPNLQYIKIISKNTSKEIEESSEPALKITELVKGENLYESKEFWDHFPNISLVTLNYIGEPSQNIEPKLCSWTNEGYNNYWCDDIY